MLRSVVKYFLSSLLLIQSGSVFAASEGPGVTFISYYTIILNALGVPSEKIGDWLYVCGGIFALLVLFVLGVLYKRSVDKAGDNVEPSGSISYRNLVEMGLDFIVNIINDTLGPNKARKYYLPLVGIFLFILVCNLSGLIPGFTPATENINTNLAMGLSVFVIYNWAGIKEHGASYIKQFLGPLWWLAPLMLSLELISHLVRPLSLSLRLYGSLFSDHMVLSVFTGLTYLVVPVFVLFFGLLVAGIQSFIFTLLSTVYISMAVSHDH